MTSRVIKSPHLNDGKVSEEGANINRSPEGRIQRPSAPPPPPPPRAPSWEWPDLDDDRPRRR
jgi:hypothetical protein